MIDTALCVLYLIVITVLVFTILYLLIQSDKKSKRIDEMANTIEELDKESIHYHSMWREEITKRLNSERK